jgi:hypothetical protein
MLLKFVHADAEARAGLAAPLVRGFQHGATTLVNPAQQLVMGGRAGKSSGSPNEFTGADIR